MTEMLEAALDYAKAGFPVFPLSPGSKIPIKGSDGFKDATTDEKIIKAMWKAIPNANIGLATHDLLVVDIDGKDNPWPSDPDQQLALSSCITCLTPSGGKHHYFRQPEGKKLRNTTGKLAPNVDTRGDGGYVLLPPSVVDGCIYEWADSTLSSDYEILAQPVDWILSGLNGVYSGEIVTESEGVAAPEGVVLPETVGKSQYNNILIKAGGYMRRMGASEGDILAIFRSMNAERFEDNVPDDHLAARAKWCAEQDSDIGTEFSVFDGEPIKFSDHAPDPGPMPEVFMECPGFLNKLRDYSMSIAHYPSLCMSFSGALAMLSMLLGGKVRDITGARTNLQVLALAHSGVGKNIPRVANKNLAYAAQMQDNIMDKFASGEGIEEALLFSNPILFQPDEVDTVISSINKAKDARHENMLGMLLTLFTESGTVHIVRRKADDKGKSKVILNPSVSVLGTAVPNHFYDALSPRMLTNGFLTRQFIIENSSPRRAAAEIPDSEAEIPPELIEFAEFWRDVSTEEPWLIEYTPAATVYIKQVQAKFDEIYNQAEAINDNVRTTLWSRATEMTRKLALIAAGSRWTPENSELEVKVSDIEWAAKLVEHQAKRMLFMVNKHVGDGGEYSKDCNKLIEKLEASDDKKLSLRDVMRAVNKPKKDVMSLIESMEAAGLIKRGERKDARNVKRMVVELIGDR